MSKENIIIYKRNYSLYISLLLIYSFKYSIIQLI